MIAELIMRVFDVPKKFRSVILKDIEGVFLSRKNKKDALNSERETYSIPFSRYDLSTIEICTMGMDY